MRLRRRAMVAMDCHCRQARVSGSTILPRRRLSLLRLTGLERRRASVGVVLGVERSWSISGGLAVRVGR